MSILILMKFCITLSFLHKITNFQEREKRKAEEARLKAEKEMREKKRKEEEIKEIQVRIITSIAAPPTGSMVG